MPFLFLSLASAANQELMEILDSAMWIKMTAINSPLPW